MEKRRGKKKTYNQERSKTRNHNTRPDRTKTLKRIKQSRNF
uniref:Uncharacterized protein n=1 Tax=Rhizophora mucronata TaxID=61149 RepID=A0A2P2N146_RHIMU